MLSEERARTRRLGRVIAKHRVLLRRQLPAPLLIRLETGNVVSFMASVCLDPFRKNSPNLPTSDLDPNAALDFSAGNPLALELLR